MLQDIYFWFDTKSFRKFSSLSKSLQKILRDVKKLKKRLKSSALYDLTRSFSLKNFLLANQWFLDEQLMW